MTPWAAFNWVAAITNSEDRVEEPVKPISVHQQRYPAMAAQISNPIFPKSEDIYLLKDSNRVGDTGLAHGVGEARLFMERNQTVSILNGFQHDEGNSMDDVSIPTSSFADSVDMYQT